MSRAKQIIEGMRRKSLQEGTVIVLNNDSPSNGHEEAVRALLARLSQDNPNTGGAHQAPAVSAAGPGAKHAPTGNDRLELNQGGRRWRFNVSRDADGNIDALDVSEI